MSKPETGKNAKIIVGGQEIVGLGAWAIDGISTEKLEKAKQELGEFFERNQMPSESVMNHERNRWETMNPRQLRTRLGRMRDREELEAFSIIAQTEGIGRYSGLYQESIERRIELGYLSANDTNIIFSALSATDSSGNTNFDTTGMWVSRSDQPFERAEGAAVEVKSNKQVLQKAIEDIFEEEIKKLPDVPSEKVRSKAVKELLEQLKDNEVFNLRERIAVAAESIQKKDIQKKDETEREFQKKDIRKLREF